MDMDHWGPIFQAEQEAYDRAFPIVIDWFVMEGGDPDLELRPPLGIPSVDLRGIAYFVGIPTGTAPQSHDVEIAALIRENPPFDQDSLRAMVSHHPLPTEDDDPAGFVEFHDEGLWAVIRLDRAELDDDVLLGTRLSGLIERAEALAEAVN